MENEIKEPAPKYNYISPEDYFEIVRTSESRYEYYDGQVIELSGANWQHNSIEANLRDDLRDFLKGQECSVKGSNVPVTNSLRNSYMLPDILIYCGKPELEKIVLDTLLNPAVIFEILSPSTRGMDKKVKRNYYKEIPTLREYIMIDSQKREVTVLRKQSGNEWESEEIITGSNNLFIETITYELTLPEIYKDTGL